MPIAMLVDNPERAAEVYEAVRVNVIAWED
jgi:hypothetical protein